MNKLNDGVLIIDQPKTSGSKWAAHHAPLSEKEIFVHDLRTKNYRSAPDIVPSSAVERVEYHKINQPKTCY